MKKLAKLFVITILLFYSCDKDEYKYPDTELTVNDLYTYCMTDGELPCWQPLNHEGDFVTVSGYYDISRHGFNLTGDEIRFYNTPDVGSINTVIIISGDSKSLFDKISDLIRENSEGEFVKLKLSGVIVGHDCPVNNGCRRAVALEIDNSSAVRPD